MPYKTLSPDKIVASTDMLYKRIHERFPNRGISKVCAELHQIAHATCERAEWINKPYWLLRVGIVLLLGMLVFVVGFLFWEVEVEVGQMDLVNFLEAINNGVNDVILIGAGIFFLFTLETRIKRQRALTALHDLRALAHVIDMHQLTKDPERVLGRWVKTASSPENAMTVFELSRYLDYCSEMLSVIGKIAALYVQGFHDAPAMAAVNEIEDLTNGLSRKIWQKIMILHTLESESWNGNHRPNVEDDFDLNGETFVQVEGWSDAED
ncbi:MAG: hypothetical protein HUU38_13245 [Anaerolineales bacterium]|nr:hypothetical protein [Anaerolineales bacterium]